VRASATSASTSDVDEAVVVVVEVVDVDVDDAVAAALFATASCNARYIKSDLCVSLSALSSKKKREG
jgi:hypothetical protein